MKMGLIRLKDKLYAKIYCNPKPLEGHPSFYPCTKDKCFKRYDKEATFSTNGKDYRLCSLFMYADRLEEIVNAALSGIGSFFKKLS